MNIPSMYDSVIERLLARRGAWPQIAADTDIPYQTLGKIARKEIRDPGVRKIETLQRHLDLLDRQDAERAAMRASAQAAG